MEKLKKALKSKTVWTLIILFVINGVDGIRELVTPETLTYIDGVLGLAAVYFKVTPSQDY